MIASVLGPHLRAHAVCCTGKHYPAAVVAYTEAIQLNPKVAAYYSNRAFAHIRLENYGSAVADASKALELDPRFTKASMSCYRHCN